MLTATCALAYLLSSPPTHPEPARLKARAALALAFADARPPTYDEQYATAVRLNQPLVVWVGQPARPFGKCVCVRCDAFPGVAGPAVVVGIPRDGTLRRIDLPGTPTDEAVRAAVGDTLPGH